MTNNKTFLAVIPARAGSKRLPNKNIKDLNGKPLISYTIEAAKNSKYISEVIVSTDSNEIKDIAIKSGAKAPFLRPEELAKDDSKSIDVITHALSFYKNNLNKEFDYVLLLQPTSPLRTQEDINNSIEYLFKKSADAVISVCEMEHNPIWSNTLDEQKSMKNFLDKKFINKRTQDLEKFYRINGAIYICKTDQLIKENRFFIDENIYAYEMSQENSVDIDTKLDFKLAETLLKEEK
ncbi:MAG: cytidylyltransferase domain-containing protein [Campylobacterota bacterium]